LSALTLAPTRTRATRARLGDAVVVAQLAASLVLLVGAALFVRSLRQIQAVDPGYDLDRLLVASADEPGASLELDGPAGLLARADAALRALPGVQAVSAASMMPFRM